MKRTKTLRAAFSICAIAIFIASACEPAHRSQPPPSDIRTAHEGPGDRELHRFLIDRQERTHTALDAAERWLDRLEVDPMVLRERGIKGKKKLTEQVDAYYRLWRIAPESERPRLKQRLIEVSGPTRQSVFHDMARIDDRQFKQDSTSYMRTAYLLDHAGIDITEYRAEIVAIHDRLNDHMPSRGPHQRHVFGTYYAHFGLEEPFPLAHALKDGYIARRADPTKFRELDAYHLTHEVFAPYDFGDDLDAEPFDDEEREYLRASLEFLVDRFIDRDNVDLVAEFVSSMRMLRLTDSPQYRRAIDYLLDSQHEDGSWGDIARAQRYGVFADQAVMLHTTLVTIDALTLALHPAWNLR